jgi:hypothetical protein
MRCLFNIFYISLQVAVVIGSHKPHVGGKMPAELLTLKYYY